jgi:hypothetical protein
MSEKDIAATVTIGHHVKQKRKRFKTCAARGCRSKPTQAFDVYSWWEVKRNQIPVHYEVCDKHASYFTGLFDRDASQRVRDDLVPYSYPHVKKEQS